VDIKNKIPFPQADDFEKVVKIVNIDDAKCYKDMEAMSRYLDNISFRQVQYYLSACMYLNIIDSNKNLTEEGIILRQLNNANQTVELIRLILSDRIFGTVYLSEKYLGSKYSREDVEYLMKNITDIENEAVIRRRAQTVMKWVEWINNCI